MSATGPMYSEQGEIVQASLRRETSLTTVLIGVNVVVFVLMTLSGASPVDPTGSELVRWGANWGPLSLGSQPWRILTSNYVHIGIVHILLNMWCLWSLGRLAEQLFDTWTYFFVYSVCGIAGSIASLWWHPSVVGAGASGAIFGLAGAVLAVLYLGKLPASREALQPTLRSLVAFVGYNLFFGLRPGVDNSAHVGGLAAGLILGAIMARVITRREELRTVTRTACLVLTTLLVALLFGLRKDAVKVRAADADPDALRKGVIAIKNNQTEDAIRNLRIAAKQDPKNGIIPCLLGGQLVSASRPEEAVAAFQEALRLRPDYADAEAGLGAAYQALGEEKEAQEAFSRAAQMSRGGR